jgi:hypothetical protein
MDQLRLFQLQHDLLKISTHLQTALAAETRLAEGQWLKEQLNVVTLRIIQFNSYLFVCQLNSPRANYKVSTSE